MILILMLPMCVALSHKLYVWILQGLSQVRVCRSFRSYHNLFTGSLYHRLQQLACFWLLYTSALKKVHRRPIDTLCYSIQDSQLDNLAFNIE